MARHHRGVAYLRRHKWMNPVAVAAARVWLNFALKSLNLRTGFGFGLNGDRRVTRIRDGGRLSEAQRK